MKTKKSDRNRSAKVWAGLRSAASMKLPPLLLLALLLSGCTSAEEPQAPTEGLITRFMMRNGTSVQEASELLQKAGMSRMRLRVSYPDHQVTRDVDLSENEPIRAFYQQERERLAFLVSNFDPSDPMEAPVHAQLAKDLDGLESPTRPDVRWIEVDGKWDFDSSFVLDTEYIYERRLEAKTTRELTSAITDWPEDAWWTPAGGTSTVSSYGTLQKLALHQV